jgi:hypothetical protein
MTFFWGAPLLDETAGLDILGVRRLDQAIESSLVNGVTTISARARYFAILPWALAEFFRNDLVAGTGQFDRSVFARYMNRVELLTLLATRLDPNVGESGGAALGADVHVAAVSAIRSGASWPVPGEGSEAMVGTYFGPCRAIGLVADGASGSGAPFRITPRGMKVWEARSAALASDPVLRSLRDVTEFSPELVRHAVPHFSLAALAKAGREAELIREALTIPWEPPERAGRERVAHAYEQFDQTLAWIRRSLSTGARGPEILTTNLSRCCRGEIEDGPSVRWAEFEWRRRTHFALELLLSAVCRALSMSGDNTVSGIIEMWREDTNQLTAGAMWPEAAAAWERTAEEAAQSVPLDLLLGLPTPAAALNRLTAGEQALTAYALIVALGAQMRALRERGGVPSRSGPGERAFDIVDAKGDTPFSAILRSLTENCAVAPHLATTLRKMGNGQKCSLRFFPDGTVLRSTGLGAQGGYSGDRLSNLLRILADTGLLTSTSGGYVAESFAR